MLLLSVARPALEDLHMEPIGAMPRTLSLKPSPLQGAIHDKEKRRDETIVHCLCSCQLWMLMHMHAHTHARTHIATLQSLDIALIPVYYKHWHISASAWSHKVQLIRAQAATNAIHSRKQECSISRHNLVDIVPKVCLPRGESGTGVTGD